MGTIFPLVASFAVLFPRSVHLLRKQLGVDQDKFIKYVLCPMCLYNFDVCCKTLFGRKVAMTCAFKQFLHHRKHFRRTACGEPLLKEASLKSGETKLYPFKVYCYNSVTENLKYFLQRPGFASKCELWRSRHIPQGYNQEPDKLVSLFSKKHNKPINIATKVCLTFRRDLQGSNL